MQSLKMAGTLGLCATLLTTACSDSPASPSPTAPSAVSTPAAALSGAGSTEISTASGNGHGNNGNGNGDNGNGNGTDKPTPTAPVPPTNTSPDRPVAPVSPLTGKVEIEGIIASKDSTAITVRGQAVLVPATAVIRHGSRLYGFADLAVGDRVHIRAIRVVSGTGTTATTHLEATEVKLQNSTGDDEDENDEDEGEDEEDELGGLEVDLQGTLSLLNGLCPTISFTVGTATVKTGTPTKFKDTACSAIKNGDRVEVEGLRQADGTVLAEEVRAVKTEARVSEIKGTLTLLSGTCPAISFTVGSTKVTTSASTKFKDGGCAAIKNGKRVEVKGFRQTDGSLLATVVEID